MLPSPFPKLLLWSPAGGVTPQAEKRWPVPWRTWREMARLALLRNKKAPGHNDRALLHWQGEGPGRPCFLHCVPWRPLGAVGGCGPRGRRRGVSLFLAKRRFKREEPGQFLTGLLSSGGPSSEDGDLHADRKKRFWKGGGKADQGRPAGPCPLRRRKLRASRLAGGRTFSPKRCPSPSAFPLSLTLRPTAVPDRCRAGRLRDRRPGGRGRLRQRPCR